MAGLLSQTATEGEKGRKGGKKRRQKRKEVMRDGGKEGG